MKSEKSIEKTFCNHIKKHGGLAIKFHSAFFTGMPDRLVFLPGGRFELVELKAEGKKASPRQVLVHTQLECLGFKVWVVDSLESMNQFFKSIEQ
jgi:hypothetical protein